jgi:hypothetical protein
MKQRKTGAKNGDNAGQDAICVWPGRSRDTHAKKGELHMNDEPNTCLGQEIMDA